MHVINIYTCIIAYTYMCVYLLPQNQYSIPLTLNFFPSVFTMIMGAKTFLKLGVLYAVDVEPHSFSENVPSHLLKHKAHF